MRKKVLLYFLIFVVSIYFVSAQEDCTLNWTCTEWSDCMNNLQIRVCIDLNTCGNNTGKPIENQTCGTTCEPNWNCTYWEPKRCPDDKIQSRNCTDLNNCETNKNRPEEGKSCRKDFSWLVIFIVIIIIILILGNVGLIKEKLSKKKKEIPPATSQSITPFNKPPPKKRILRPIIKKNF